MSWHSFSLRSYRDRYRYRYCVVATTLSLFLVNGVAVSPLAAATVTTSFESSQVAPFTVGTAPISLDLSAGIAQTVGQPQFYRSGFFFLAYSAR